jgi:hypothetical protein
VQPVAQAFCSSVSEGFLCHYCLLISIAYCFPGGCVRASLVDQVQRGIDLNEEASDFIALLGTRIFLQPFQ